MFKPTSNQDMQFKTPIKYQCLPLSQEKKKSDKTQGSRVVKKLEHDGLLMGMKLVPVSEGQTDNDNMYQKQCIQVT